MASLLRYYGDAATMHYDLNLFCTKERKTQVFALVVPLCLIMWLRTYVAQRLGFLSPTFWAAAET